MNKGSNWIWIEVGCTYVLEPQILLVLGEVSLVRVLIRSGAICPIFFTLKRKAKKTRKRRTIIVYRVEATSLVAE